MANIKSQKKRIRTNEERRQRNVAVRSRVKTMGKRALSAIEAKEPEQMRTELTAAISAVDRACAKGVLHRNTAARRKAILQTRYNQAQ